MKTKYLSCTVSALFSYTKHSLLYLYYVLAHYYRYSFTALIVTLAVSCLLFSVDLSFMSFV